MCPPPPLDSHYASEVDPNHTEGGVDPNHTEEGIMLVWYEILMTGCCDILLWIMDKIPSPSPQGEHRRKMSKTATPQDIFQNTLFWNYSARYNNGYALSVC